jgi:hypothetical protein
LIVLVWAAGGLAGCGSGAKPSGGPSGGPAGGSSAASGIAMAKPGAAGTIGRPTSGRYKATNHTVLYRIKVALVRFLTSRGFSGVTVYCTALGDGGATCNINGMNRSNQTGSNVLTLSLNRDSGALQITHVRS